MRRDVRHGETARGEIAVVFEDKAGAGDFQEGTIEIGRFGEGEAEGRVIDLD
jgi:hypothetical protein